MPCAETDPCTMGIDVCTRVGRRIRYLRSVRGISQTVLADRAAISRINLSRIENGKAEAGLRTIANLARAMDMKMAELLDGID